MIPKGRVIGLDLGSARIGVAVTDSGQTTVGTQMVYAWIDADGLVAGFVVNPTSIPQKPSPCRAQRPDTPPDSAPVPAAKPKDA